MRIKDESFNEIFNLSDSLDKSDVKISLFIASNKSPKLKKLDLAGLTPDERVGKLQKWAKDSRFVAVIEKGDTLYAHVSPRFAERLSDQQDLSIDGKKVSVKALTDSEYERLSVIGETFEDYIRLNPEEELQEGKEEKEKSKNRRESSHAYVREYFAQSSLLSDVIKMDLLILQMRNIPEKIKLAFIKKMNEMQHEIDRRKKEEASEKDAKSSDIKRHELEKRIVKEETVKEETVKKDVQNLSMRWETREKNRG